MSHEQSILDSTKRALGLAPTYDVFDPELIMHINSVFMKLQQLGIGPDQGFMIEDEAATWGDFLGEGLQYTAVMTYMTLSVKMVFDPPGTSFLLASYEKQIAELEFRLMVQRDSIVLSPVVISPSPPTFPADPSTPIFVDVDGGGADLE